MVDITTKIVTLREATASAIVCVSNQETINAIREKRVPKGDVFEMSRAAGLLGIKKTPDLIPDCHPIPIESASISYEIDDLNISITVHVKSIYKTGVEVEAMHGASVVAVTLYDMLKPIDKGIQINSIRLIEKKGGKSDFSKRNKQNTESVRAAVVVCSDTISAGQKEDKAGKAIITKLNECGVKTDAYEVIPDELNVIRDRFNKYHDLDYQLLIYTGGTGLSARDVTPEAIEPLLDRRIPGIEEAIRSYGQDRTPYSMLSRSLAGTKGKMLVLALPGSTQGARESMDAVFPDLLHIYNILHGGRHDLT